MLPNIFVVAPIDTASSNVAFVCQRHYAQVLINELGLNKIRNIMSPYMRVIHHFGKMNLTLKSLR